MQISKADTESAFIAMTTWGWERGLWQNKLLRRSQNVKKKMGASLKAVKAWLLFALAAAALHHRANKLLLLTMRIYFFLHSFVDLFIFAFDTIAWKRRIFDQPRCQVKGGKNLAWGWWPHCYITIEQHSDHYLWTWRLIKYALGCIISPEICIQAHLQPSTFAWRFFLFFVFGERNR